MAVKALPSPEVLRQLLRYEPETGKLFWLPRDTSMFSAGGRTSSDHAAKTWNTKYAHAEAFTARKVSGHLHGLILRNTIQAHIAAWAIHYGSFPAENIDHINHNPADNRICNLRLAGYAENAKNRSPNKAKASGLPHGVSVKHNASGPRYFAQIQANKKSYHLGYFDTVAAASDAYAKAAASKGFHANHAIIRALIAQEGEA